MMTNNTLVTKKRKPKLHTKSKEFPTFIRQYDPDYVCEEDLILNHWKDGPVNCKGRLMDEQGHIIDRDIHDPRIDKQLDVDGKLYLFKLAKVVTPQQRAKMVFGDDIGRMYDNRMNMHKVKTDIPKTIRIHNQEFDSYYILGYGGAGFSLMPSDVIIKDQPNMEKRTALLRVYGYERFIRENGGKLELLPKPGDYPNGWIYSLIMDNYKMVFLKLINRTIEPGAETLSKEDRISSGLTEDGFKIYVQGIPNDVEWPYIAYACQWAQGRMNKDFTPVRPSVESIMKAAKDSGKPTTLKFAEFLSDAVYQTNKDIIDAINENIRLAKPYNLEIES